MNKKKLSHPWSRKLFKISILAVLLQINILGITLVYSATGQNVLETSISLKSENLHFKELLNQIEKQANVKFIYSSSIINTKQKLSFAVSNNKLETVLKDLLAPRNISYTVSGNRIMLKVVKSDENKYLEGVLQDRNITGKVTDKNGDPLPGVTVIVKNTQRGNITDTNGDFSISVPDTETSILVFSFVGFATKEVEIGTQTSINVSLDIDEKSLEEVVVVGYGSVKRKDLTGSVAQISPDAYKSQPVQDVSEMLRGNAPGVLVKTNGDGSTKIRIRGSNSLNGNNDPLYIVDGVPMGSYSPNDVESIEILKDASATAIYGSRGANGVVIITTKRGKKGDPSVDISANTSFATYPQFYDLLNGPEFADYYNSYFGRNIDFDKSVNTDWQRVTTQTGIRQNYQATLSGGNDNLKFYVGGNYIHNKGQVINQSNNTYRLRTNLDFKLGSKFTGRIDVSGAQNRSHGSSITGKGPLFSVL